MRNHPDTHPQKNKISLNSSYLCPVSFIFLWKWHVFVPKQRGKPSKLSKTGFFNHPRVNEGAAFEITVLVVDHLQPPSKGGTWRIIPISKWLITMVSKSRNWGYSPSKSPKWLINGGYYLLTNCDDPPSMSSEGGQPLSNQWLLLPGRLYAFWGGKNMLPTTFKKGTRNNH